MKVSEEININVNLTKTEIDSFMDVLELAASSSDISKKGRELADELYGTLEALRS